MEKHWVLHNSLKNMFTSVTIITQTSYLLLRKDLLDPEVILF